MIRWMLVPVLSSVVGFAYVRTHASDDPSAFGGQFWDGALNTPRQEVSYVPVVPIYEPVVRWREDNRYVQPRPRPRPMPHYYAKKIDSDGRFVRKPLPKTAAVRRETRVMNRQDSSDGRAPR